MMNFRRAIGTALAVLCMTFLSVAAASAQHHDSDHDGHHWRAKHGRYVTDDNGAELLRAAVRNGYQQGFQAGVADRSTRRNNWRRNQMYISADMGYQSGVERTQYQYYFQQGFQKGYDDGFYSRTRYGRDNSILDNVLNGILGLTRW
jgi:flagellar biosynthesis/type III secretory pathway protein FliH